MTKQINKKLQEKLMNYEKTPPKGTFAKIQRRMDDDKKGIFWLPFVRYGMAASLAFLVGMGVMYNFGVNPLKQQINASTDKVEQLTIENESNPNENKLIESVSLNKEKTNDKTANNEGDAPSNVNTANIPSKITKNTAINTYADNVDKKNSAQTDIQIQTPKDYEYVDVYNLYNIKNAFQNNVEIVKVEDDIVNTRFDNTKDRGIGYKGIWLGPSLHYQSKWIAGNHLNGTGFGFDAGIDFTKKWGIQSGVNYMLSLKSYPSINDEGISVQKIEDFSSFTFPLSLRYKKTFFSRKLERPISINTIAGIDYSRLGNLNKHQAGFHVGMEYDIFLKSEMMLTLGTRLQVAHIYNYDPPSEFVKGNTNPLHYNLGIYTALRFIRPLKK